MPRQSETIESTLVTTVSKTDSKTVELRVAKRGGAYFIRNIHSRNGVQTIDDQVGQSYTVFTKDDSCGKGEYVEEIDVMVARRDRDTAAKKVAALAIKAHYCDSLRPSRVVARLGWF